MARIARIARGHADLALALLAIAAAACGIYAGTEQDRLAVGGGPNGATRLAVRVHGEGKVTSPAFRIPLSVMTTSLRSDTGVARVTRVVSADRNSVTLVVRLSGSPSERSAAISRIESGLDPGPLTIAFSGEAGNATSDRDQAFGDLPLLLLAAVPATVLAIFLLGAGPALAALICLAATVFATAAVCVALAEALDLTVLALVGAACAGVPAALLASGVVARGPVPRRLPVAAIAGALAFAATAAVGAGGSRSLALSGGIAWLIAAPIGLLGMTAGGELWEGRTPPALRSAPARSRVRLAALALLAIAAAALVAAAALGLCHVAFSGGIPKLTGLAVVATVGACSLAASASGDRRAAILAEGITALAATSLLLSGLRVMQIVAFGMSAGLLVDLIVVRALGPLLVARVRAR